MWTLAIVNTIWTIFLVHKRFQLFGCKTQSIQERWQERVPTGSKSYKGKSRFQPVYAIEESAGQSCRKLCSRRKFDPSADTYNVQRHGWTTQTGSQGSWGSGPSKQKDLCDCVAVQCGQAWQFLCSIRLFARKKEDEKFPQVVYVNYTLEEFIFLLELMNSANDKVITNQPICNVL